MPRILIVEDDKKIARLLQLELTHRHYETQIAVDGMQALDDFEQFKPDVVLLDVMIPDLDGVEVAKMIREQDKQTGIIMVTALDQTRNKVEGLQSGADDYLTKPFDFDELNARIEALLRRKGSEKLAEIQFGHLRFFPDSYRLLEDSDDISLSKTEYDLILYLVRNKNRVVSKDELLERVWGYDFEGNANVVEVYINYLRKKIKSGKHMIKTIRGVGYTVIDDEDHP